MKNPENRYTGYKRENHEIILQSPIPEQHRFIHNIDTSIASMVDVENYTPTYSGDIPNFNTMDLMELKQFQESNSTQLLEKHNLLKTNISKYKQSSQKEDTPETINVQSQKTE